ncbi:adenosylhomocysteinase [Subtercola lobariae]|uniref:S-adenosyl-L-homocysteine hydrolase n=1 Tax=Subtercola lobariae TaxID=1588641 RepID=A0A917B107_9MICO|nr:adenosylhomocysteinase [Subtercola lobariae]GGF13601.1 S-adenosyl-L-homocysteine hydrolase [Subtercola lobariae]
MSTQVNDDSALVERAARRLEWIRSRMPLLAGAREHFAQTQPFAGHTIGMSLHLEPKTAILVETLAAGGATVVGTGNHGSTQDDIAAFLRSQGLTIFGRRDDTLEQHHENVAAVLDARPSILLDNGADLAAGVIARGSVAGVGGGESSEGSADLGGAAVLGGTEETTSGANRLRAELAGRVPFPVIVINDSVLKQIGENRHAVGQSVVESFMRITNLMIPGARFVVVGYGWCGRGVAQYLRSLGGKVAIAEIDELKAFEAALDGYRVDSAVGLASWADVVITATGQPGVVGPEVFAELSDGVVLANCGHFPWEIDVPALMASATKAVAVDEAIDRIELPDGRSVVLIAQGRMFNLAGREPKGNSIQSMDLGFMLQALSLERVALGAAGLVAGAQPVPDDIERTIARRLLASMAASL